MRINHLEKTIKFEVKMKKILTLLVGIMLLGAVSCASGEDQSATADSCLNRLEGTKENPLSLNPIPSTNKGATKGDLCSQFSSLKGQAHITYDVSLDAGGADASLKCYLQGTFLTELSLIDESDNPDSGLESCQITPGNEQDLMIFEVSAPVAGSYDLVINESPDTQPWIKPSCFHTISETRSWDISGDGVIDQTEVISNYYDITQNRIGRIQIMDVNLDNIDDRVATSYSQFNEFGDYEIKVVETDLSSDNTIDLTESSVYAYSYDINQKVYHREEGRTISVPNSPDVNKILMYDATYDVLGNRVSNMLEIDDNGTIATQDYLMTYDVNGKILTKRYNYNGSPRYFITNTNSYFYTYLTNVVWIKENWDKNGSLPRSFGETDMSYDGNNDLVLSVTREYSNPKRTGTPDLIYRAEKTRAHCSVLGP
ncbi:MAG: hypothetical protein OEY59_06490 [Deltaproteobacteria bacterium]|nr:hypothetical protein [Deltaproteobacteria bacterium]